MEKLDIIFGICLVSLPFIVVFAIIGMALSFPRV